MDTDERLRRTQYEARRWTPRTLPLNAKPPAGPRRAIPPPRPHPPLVRLEFVVRPPLGAGPSPGSGRPNGHCSVRHGPPCGRRRRSTACGPSTTRGCVPRCRRPDARRHATLSQSWIQRENWEFETHRRTPMATFRIRPGLRKSDPNPNSSRSLAVRCGARWRRRALLHESSLARTMPIDKILTGRCDTTLVGRGRSSD